MKTPFAALFAALALIAGTLIACAQLGGVGQFVEDHEALAKTAVQLATIEFLKKNPKNTDRLVEISDQVKAAVEAGQVATVEVASVYVRQLIDYSKLDPTEAVLLDNLIDVAQQELSKLIREQGLTVPEAHRAELARVVGWVADAGRTMQGRPT